MLNVTLLENHEEIRKNFNAKFVYTQAEFELHHKDWIERNAAQGHPLSYDRLLLWDKMPPYQAISFDRALEFLKSMNGDVYAMSEPTREYGRSFTIEGECRFGEVIQVNPMDLAERIEYEWYEERRLGVLDQYLEDAMLPVDLYVFDPTMEHLLVFTHENDFWDLESTQPMVAAKSRFCMCEGFPLPPAASYEELKAAIAKSPKPNTVLTLELSYALKGYFRAFTVCKRLASDRKGYEYWFDHAPEIRYTSIEALEQAKAFYEDSLLTVAADPTVRFEIHSVKHTPTI